MMNPEWSGTVARTVATQAIHKYFTTQNIPLTKHHIDSYDQFIQRDLQAIIATENPLINLKEPFGDKKKTYKYKVEIYVGGLDGTAIRVGTPTIRLNQGEDVRVLFPNEARLRNLTYSLPIQVDILYRVTIKADAADENPAVYEETISNFPIAQIPLMLHSRYCPLHGKPQSTLVAMGECPEDSGGYFIIDGSEKVLITRQEQAFNTLYISEQKRDPKVQYYATMQSLNPRTRMLTRANLYWEREREKYVMKERSYVYYPSVMEVKLPQVTKPIPLFIVFRALGIQTDKDIINTIFPDMDSPETAALAELLIPSMHAAAPTLTTYDALFYIQQFVKGFSLVRVYDILMNEFFCHIDFHEDKRDFSPKIAFLAQCVRSMLRVVKKLDPPTNKDDTRNQRLITSGFSVQKLFQGIYGAWQEAVSRTINEEYNYHKQQYAGENFKNLFSAGMVSFIFKAGFIDDGIARAFKGKWSVGAEGDEEAGIVQALARISYLDFMSHCRRVVLDFDTGLKLTGPRQLQTSQYGYYCTSETPSGGHIGVTKNLSIFTSISNGMIPTKLIAWLYKRAGVLAPAEATPQLIVNMVPVFVNNCIIGYTENPEEVAAVLRCMKRTGCLPPYSSNGFNRRTKTIFIYTDEGRPLRPLFCVPLPDPQCIPAADSWKTIVCGNLPQAVNADLPSVDFIDIYADQPEKTLADYIAALSPHMGVVEYLDPYEQNEAYIANVPEHIRPGETTHMEVHPSSILGLLGCMIPFANHNQSPRNQLSASQSKQSLAMYATNFQNRYDNNANILCYPEMPLSRTVYQDYIGSGRMGYGHNLVLAMAIHSGYNQEDGIVINKSALERGMFRNITYRSYDVFEEDDPLAKTKTRIANPNNMPAWLDVHIGYDYSKLDPNGIIKPGSYVDENTVIVGRYMTLEDGRFKDASVTPQVWTSGRVDEVITLVGPNGLRIVKIRVVHDRVPELGDKFSNRHGQKGTIGMMVRGMDMPRTSEGIVPDMIMNPHAIPSRMTIAQLLEQLFGKTAANLGALANATTFMNEGSPHEVIGDVLEEIGLERFGNEILYDGQSGKMIEAAIFIGPVYNMRLKHMTEDKWNARGAGRKEQRTHQPTGGRGAQGGLKIGEMERDAIVAHGLASFTRESMMERSDKTEFVLCNGCGTIPIYNERQDLYICSLCDGPIQYSGSTADTMEPIIPTKRSAVSFSRVEMPYATKLFIQEMNMFMNMGTRILTTHDVERLPAVEDVEEATEEALADIESELPTRTYEEDTDVAPYQPAAALPTLDEIRQNVAELQVQQQAAVEAEREARNRREAVEAQIIGVNSGAAAVLNASASGLGSASGSPLVPTGINMNANIIPTNTFPLMPTTGPVNTFQMTNQANTLQGMNVMGISNGTGSGAGAGAGAGTEVMDVNGNALVSGNAGLDLGVNTYANAGTNSYANTGANTGANTNTLPSIMPSLTQPQPGLDIVPGNAGAQAPTFVVDTTPAALQLENLPMESAVRGTALGPAATPFAPVAELSPTAPRRSRSIRAPPPPAPTQGGGYQSYSEYPQAQPMEPQPELLQGGAFKVIKLQ
jgi:DNA-directed RNA polymerase II subunit RPB2